MHVKFILPALTEAHGRYWRPIKYSLFPPLGLATLAGYLDPGDDAEICDEHVEPLRLDDAPDLVAIETYVTSARRAYRIADHYRRRGVPVVLGGLHATACPAEALAHADAVVLGPAEEAWPRFLTDFRRGRTKRRLYRSRVRDLSEVPPLRRDLIRRRNYLLPNSLVVSRGCPHRCDFCYSDSFYRGGKSFYHDTMDRAVAKVRGLPGRHLFFLDDNVFADAAFAAALFRAMAGLGRVWQGAATVRCVLDTDLLDLAVRSGLRSLFVGFESLNQAAMVSHGKRHNRVGEYDRAVEQLHDRGVMINASFVFGLDGDDPSVFDATTEWAVSRGIETATFHILTPYPGTALYRRYRAAGRILHHDWDQYDTRHAVFRHPNMSADVLERGHWRAYEQFYRWGGILRSAATKPSLAGALRHAAYVGAWKKLDPLWALLIRLRRLGLAVRPMEQVLAGPRRLGAEAETDGADGPGLDRRGAIDGRGGPIGLPPEHRDGLGRRGAELGERRGRRSAAPGRVSSARRGVQGRTHTGLDHAWAPEAHVTRT